MFESVKKIFSNPLKISSNKTSALPNSSVGMCPACKDVVTIKNKMLYFACPHCGDTVSTSEARIFLESMCADPIGVNRVLTMCIELEQEYGVEVPLEILGVLARHHPHNEQVAFTIVRMSGYRSDLVKQYLGNFCAAKKSAVFAAEFLENTLLPQYMPLVNQFSQYIENKLEFKDQKKYREKLNEVKEIYLRAPSKGSGDGMMLLYAYYIIGAVINVGMAVLLVLLSLHIIFNMLIAAGIFFVELFLLFLHNRNYGNRIGIEDRERLLLVIFISSIFVTVGGVVLGALF